MNIPTDSAAWAVAEAERHASIEEEIAIREIGHAVLAAEADAQAARAELATLRRRLRHLAGDWQQAHQEAVTGTGPDAADLLETMIAQLRTLCDTEG